MSKTRKREKPCFNCERKMETLYRIRYKQDGAWVFVCGECWPQFSSDNPEYTYGGTWKSKKRHNG